MAVVDIRGVRKSFGSTEVLHGVDVHIDDGEFVVLVGPSGCGKSTLLRMIAGLEEITAGEIAIGGRVVNEVPPKDRDIAMVFQNYALYPHMNGLRQHGLQPAAARSGPKADRASASTARPRSSGSTALLERKPAPALRRPAAARRHGPRHRARPAGVPLRRAALEPRRQAARRRCAPRSRSCTSGSATTTVYVTHDQIEAMTMADGSSSCTTATSSRSGRRSSSTTGPPTSSSPASSARRHELHPRHVPEGRPERLGRAPDRRAPAGAPHRRRGRNGGGVRGPARAPRARARTAKAWPGRSRSSSKRAPTRTS